MNPRLEESFQTLRSSLKENNAISQKRWDLARDAGAIHPILSEEAKYLSRLLGDMYVSSLRENGILSILADATAALHRSSRILERLTYVLIAIGVVDIVTHLW